MSARSDKRGAGVSLMTVFGVLVAATIAGAYWWYAVGMERPAALPQQTAPAPAPPARPDEPLSLTLYLPHDGALDPLVVTVKRDPDAQVVARDAVTALLAAEGAGRLPVLGALRLRSLFFDGSGTAFLDLIPAGQKDIRASAADEILAVYALVNSLTGNFSEIRQVRLLVDGREAQTLAGHIDVMRPLGKRTDLVRRQR
ncbi:MAG: GerMN domain-containing protein [Nitrospiraceae bacterium]|nr:GerMN domain-containing protein [Nitrospiraceae bacterium]